MGGGVSEVGVLLHDCDRTLAGITDTYQQSPQNRATANLPNSKKLENLGTPDRTNSRSVLYYFLGF
jgi:hypothetical protein